MVDDAYWQNVGYQIGTAIAHPLAALLLIVLAYLIGRASYRALRQQRWLKGILVGVPTVLLAFFAVSLLVSH